ncbi:MAG TPA: hypothetical protein PLS00_12985 [Niabella sp.]|nr:hypothetical protein [Niabella sp.]
MLIKYIGLFVFFFSACNRIESGKTLNESDIKYIQGLGLLDENEIIYRFYSEFKKRNAGNFFTDKRIATYWIDERDEGKNELSFAFYGDIVSIDTVYNAGLTFSPYMLVKKSNDQQFKVSVGGSRDQIKSFFEEALKQWNEHK